ncbi:MAG TPA: ferredoxin reductase [Conexibacter sp.]|nr:ferredoxin reductase [Conexibacter sp.]
MFTETPTRLTRKLLGSPLAAALTTPHGVDRYAELVRPAFSLREVRAEVVAVRRATARSVTLALRPNANWEGFRAGQFVRLSVEVDGVRHTRCYSPASSAHAGDLIELTAHARPDGVVSPFLRASARPGAVVALSQAQGDFALPDERPRELLLVSGGSGITPVMSMLRTLCHEGHRGAIAFLHYARDERDVAYARQLAELAAGHANVRLLHGYTRKMGAGELQGRFSREHVRAAGVDPARALTFACGPAALVDAVRATWTQDGLDARLFVEQFAPPAPARVDVAGGHVAGSVRFARSGVEASSTAAPLLDQAEAAGLTPTHGCRMGICHTCTCRKLEGAVRDVRTGEVSTAPDELIQICVNAPVGDVTLDI